MRVVPGAVNAAPSLTKTGVKTKPALARAVRVGVVGAGVFGGYHAQKFANSKHAELTGVLDKRREAASALTGKIGQGEAFRSFEALADASDALVIATPASTHAEFARRAIEMGKHVLVEKPLALSGAEARSLAKLALERNVILQVGHQERLVFQAMGLFSTGEKPRRIEASRMGPRSPEGRCEDVSVVFDLMIHDLDLAAELFGADAMAATAFGRSAHTDLLDEASAELVFPNGIAKLTASRCSPARKRTMKIDYPSGRVEIDMITREVRNDTPFDIRADVSAILPDPLAAADEAFLAAIQGRSVSPVTGGVGARAAALAELVERGAAVAEAA
jgi:predicted dehydrogenase